MRENKITLSNWRPGPRAPAGVRSLYGAAVSLGNVAYFSIPDSNSIQTLTLPGYKWGLLQQRCPYSCFSLAIVNGKLTTIGGTHDKSILNSVTNVLFSLSENWLGKKWKELLPPMPTKRMCPASVTSASHLVVAGGSLSIYNEKLAVVDVMNTDTLEWFQAWNLPQPVRYPQMTLAGDFLFLCDESATFSCSLNELLIKSSRPGSNMHDGPSVWSRRGTIPVQYAPTLAMVKGQILAVGGKTAGDVSTADIYRYSQERDSWDVIGCMPTARSHVVAVVLVPTNELVVVGGVFGDHSVTTEIGECLF